MYFQRERKGRRKRGKETSVGCLSYTPNPGMCPDWESNLRPFFHRLALNPLSHTSQGSYPIFLA